LNHRAENIKKALEGRTLKYIDNYKGSFTCLCGGESMKGLLFEDIVTGERVILGERCALRHLPPGTIPKRPKGRRVKYSQDFLSSWGGSVK
jgi:hypothetical protein